MEDQRSSPAASFWLWFCCFNQDIASDIIRLRLRRPIPEEIRRIYHPRIFSEVCTDLPDFVHSFDHKHLGIPEIILGAIPVLEQKRIIF